MIKGYADCLYSVLNKLRYSLNYIDVCVDRSTFYKNFILLVYGKLNDDFFRYVLFF